MAGEDFGSRNQLSFDSLKRVAGGLSREELLEPIDPPWTAAALFAHVAFWDRFTHARWLEAIDPATGTPVPIEDSSMELTNRAALPGWTSIPPDVGVKQCLAAARAIDDFLLSLDPALVSGVLEEGRPRLIDRSIHRREHLDTIERAFKGRRS